MQRGQWFRWWKRQGARELQAILWDDWDPLHVKEMDPSWPRTEYDGYMTEITAQLRADPDPTLIAALLTDLRTHAMGERRNDKVDESVARKITSWYSLSMSVLGGPDYVRLRRTTCR